MREILQAALPRGGCWAGFSWRSLYAVVIDYSHFERIAILPLEANAPLIVDAHAVLPFAVAFQGFEPICGWNPQIVHGRGVVEHTQLATCDLLDVRRQPSGWRAVQIFPASLSVNPRIMGRL